jgi:hypothetical protein
MRLVVIILYYYDLTTLAKVISRCEIMSAKINYRPVPIPTSTIIYYDIYHLKE